MRPLLVVLDDGEDHAITAIRSELASRFSLSQADVAEMIPSGRVTTFQNRVGWAATYLYRTKLIDRPKRAVYRITDRGRDVLKQNPDRVDLTALSHFPELEEFRQSRTAPTDAGGLDTSAADELTPEERIDRAHQELRSALAAELLDRVSDQSPEFFEQVVLDVLHALARHGCNSGGWRLGWCVAGPSRRRTARTTFATAGGRYQSPWRCLPRPDCRFGGDGGARRSASAAAHLCATQSGPR